MRAIKNFFYNVNDLILVAVILFAAAALIYWRLDVILDYPEQVLENQNNTTVVDEIEVEPEETPVVSEEEPEEEPVEEEPEEEPGIATGAIFENGKLSEDVTVTIQGGSATEAVKSLVEANFFESYSQYADAVESFDKKPENIRAGTYSFRKDTTLESVINAITF